MCLSCSFLSLCNQVTCYTWAWSLNIEIMLYWMSVSLRPLKGLDWLSNFLRGSHAILRGLIQMIVHLNTEVTLASLQSRPLLISKWAIFLLLSLIKWLSEVTLDRWRYRANFVLLLFDYRRLSNNFSEFWSLFQIPAQRFLLIIRGANHFGRARCRIGILLSFSTHTFLRLNCVKFFLSLIFLNLIFLRLRSIQILYRKYLDSFMKLLNILIMLFF